MMRVFNIFLSTTLLIVFSPFSLAGSLKESDLDLVTKTRLHGRYPCTECHGLEGTPPITDQYDKQSPILAGQHVEYLERQLLAFKSGQRKAPEMDGVLQDYTSTEIKRMALYFSTQIRPAVSDIDPTIDTLIHTRSEDLLWITQGEVLYQQGDVTRVIEPCISCHGRSGEGEKQSQSPVLSGQYARYIRMTLQAYRHNSRITDKNIGSPMGKISKKLNEIDIRNIAAYLQGMDASQ